MYHIKSISAFMLFEFFPIEGVWHSLYCNLNTGTMGYNSMILHRCAEQVLSMMRTIVVSFFTFWIISQLQFPVHCISISWIYFKIFYETLHADMQIRHENVLRTWIITFILSFSDLFSFRVFSCIVTSYLFIGWMNLTLWN